MGEIERGKKEGNGGKWGEMGGKWGVVGNSEKYIVGSAKKCVKLVGNGRKIEEKWGNLG